MLLIKSVRKKKEHLNILVLTLNKLIVKYVDQQADIDGLDEIQINNTQKKTN